MSSSILYRFTSYIDSVVIKHKLQVKRFRLARTQWGNIDPMIERIGNDLWKRADLYEIDPSRKKKIIGEALQTIKSFYH